MKSFVQGMSTEMGGQELLKGALENRPCERVLIEFSEEEAMGYEE